MAQVDARVVVEVVSDDVNAGLEPGAAQCRLSGLFVQVIGGKHERLIGGEALRLVDRHRVAVVEVAGVEVAGGKDPIGSVDQTDVQRSSFGIDRRDHASEPVQQAVRPLVPQAHHAIAGSEFAVAGDERLWAESPAIEHLAVQGG